MSKPRWPEPHGVLPGWARDVGRLSIWWFGWSSWHLRFRVYPLQVWLCLGPLTLLYQRNYRMKPIDWSKAQGEP